MSNNQERVLRLVIALTNKKIKELHNTSDIKVASQIDYYKNRLERVGTYK